ncbi:MAG TPA: hypothetical protein VN783_06370 [Thermoanaerobaculia bacterium]|nr:hypothetical protein [Thermoanaerobaculia bacterium]
MATDRIFPRGATALAAALASLLGAAPARPAVQTSATYQCTLDISASTNDCTAGIITVTSSAGSQRVATINLAPSWVRLDAFVNVCNPTGWWIHFADSPTCDGFGGDVGTAEHDAEAYNLATAFQFFGMDNLARAISDPSYVAASVVPASGCFRVQYTIYEDQVSFDDDGDPADPPLVSVHSVRGFESAPYAEADSEDTTSADANKWYVGVNRTVGSTGRTGTGANKVCFVLSTTTSPTAAALAALCP